MVAYANPENIKDEQKRADGFGIARFKKKTREVVFECWPRFSDVRDGKKAQFPGWPVTIQQEANDGRKAAAYLPEYHFGDGKDFVVQVIQEDTGEILYTTRTQGGAIKPKVFSTGKHTVKFGRDFPDGLTLTGVQPEPSNSTIHDTHFIEI